MDSQDTARSGRHQTSFQNQKSRSMRSSSAPYYEWSSSSKTYETHYLKIPSSSPAFSLGFYDKSQPSPSKSHGSQSQCKQDRYILEVLRDKKEGYFIDLAANHWKDLSNTVDLETTYNWRGLCFEPNPLYISGILANRRCNVVKNPVMDRMDQNVTFRRKKHISGILGFDNKRTEQTNSYGIKSDDVTMSTVTLQHALRYFNSPKVIDYLSLDIEGAEYNALKDHDFDKFLFRVVTIERPNEELHRLMIKNNYSMVAVLCNFGEILYVHNNVPNLETLLQKYAPLRNVSTFWGPIQESYSYHDYIYDVK